MIRFVVEASRGDRSIGWCCSPLFTTNQSQNPHRQLDRQPFVYLGIKMVFRTRITISNLLLAVRRLRIVSIAARKRLTIHCFSSKTISENVPGPSASESYGTTRVLIVDLRLASPGVPQVVTVVELSQVSECNKMGLGRVGVRIGIPLRPPRLDGVCGTTYPRCRLNPGK